MPQLSLIRGKNFEVDWTLYNTDFEISWVKFSWLASRPQKFYRTKIFPCADQRLFLTPDQLTTQKRVYHLMALRDSERSEWIQRITTAINTIL